MFLERDDRSGSRVLELGVGATKMRPSVESFWKTP
jgi:hypothetical protein